jgi:hypothetical protein
MDEARGGLHERSVKSAPMPKPVQGKDMNGTAHIQHQCRKATVLSCHRCRIKTGVEKMNKI